MRDGNTFTVSGGELHDAVRALLKDHWDEAIVTYNDDRGICVRVDVTDGDSTYEAVGIFNGPVVNPNARLQNSRGATTCVMGEALYWGNEVSCLTQDGSGISAGVPESLVQALQGGTVTPVIMSPLHRKATEDDRKAVGL